ncbi:MAG: 1-(5-phosphoribosyl)-5-[Oscillospiraceae bacterium]|nr:1-(5-phosphoribosyl)-5-[(5-phosphoribosylamino)methylideneamino]imidazole-4-carboxamide isomerase [Oscillospiraceae bacterium]
MILYPAIDLYQGQVVRLEKGRFDRMTVYDKDPLSRARRMKEEGATHLHLVDLEGARFGGTANCGVIGQIAAQTGLFLEVGGGIRSMETIRRYLDLGISRVILGTAAVENEALLSEAIERYGKAVAVGMDLLDGTVAVRGWEQGSEWTAERFLRHLASLGVQTVICTDISRDGILSGSNHDLYKQLNQALPVDLIASGGVSGLEDLLALKDLGMAGAIVGKAYYSGAVSLRNALREVQEC